MSFSAARPPAVGALQMLCAVTATVLLPHPLTVAISLAGAVAYACLLGVFAHSLLLFLPFAALVALTNPLFSHEGATVLFWLGDIPYTLEALAYGVNIALMLTAVMVWCRAFSAVLTADKLMALGGKRCPRLVLTLCMARRLLPLFTRRWQEVRLARRSLGLLGGRHRVREETNAFMAVIAWSLENAVISARSMEARGYALTGHTAFAPYTRSISDTVLMAVTLAATAVTVTATALGGGDFTWYPTMSAVGTSVWDITLYAASAVLFLTPAVFEGEERVRWRSCVSTD